MDKGVAMADRELVVRTLRELVEALDRRVAHVERLGETRIAREAAACFDWVRCLRQRLHRCAQVR